MFFTAQAAFYEIVFGYYDLLVKFELQIDKGNWGRDHLRS